MSEWTNTSLGNFVTFQRGHDLPKTKMKDGRYPVLGSNGIIGWHDQATTEGPSLVIGRSGNTGKPFYYEGPAWAHNTSLYVRDFHGNNPYYAYCLLRTLQLGQHAGGSAVPTLNRNHIHSLEIQVPDLLTQDKTARVLKCFDDAIYANNQLNDYLAA